MKHVFYYQITAPTILEAYNADLMAVARIEARAEAFAAMFGAKPLFTSGYASHFAGITFLKGTLPLHPHLWTKLEEGLPTVPRSPERAGSKHRAAAELMYKRFYDNWPTDIAQERVSTLYTALGLKAEQLDSGKELFVLSEPTKGILYLMTTLQFPQFTEITTSTYLRAIHG